MRLIRTALKSGEATTSFPAVSQHAFPMQKLLLSLYLSLCALSAFAQIITLRPGDPVPTLALKDQHDKPARLPADLKQIVFAGDKAASDLAADWLDAQAADWLARTQRVYLADIHKMPGLVTRLIALPKLRDKRYPIILGREAGELTMFPLREKCVTLLPVAAGKLGEPAFACDAAALKAAFQ